MNPTRLKTVVLRAAPVLLLLVFAPVAAAQDPELAPIDSLPAADSLATSTTAPDSIVSEPLAPTKDRPSPLALRGNGRPNPITAVWKAAGACGSDMIHLYTSPVRMSAANVLWLGAVVGTGAVLYKYDEEVYDGFQRSREDPVYDAVVIQAGNFFEPLGLVSRTHLWLEGAAVAGWVLDVPLLRTIPVEILESNFIVGTMRQPIERIVHRRRPSEGEGPRSFTGGSSFPSGHASVVCETASILSHHLRHPLARTAIWGVVAVACAQRVDEPGHNHWASDVWLGAALGTWAGHTIARRNEERRQGIPQPKWYDIFQRPDRSWSVNPIVGSDGAGLAARVDF